MSKNEAVPVELGFVEKIEELWRLSSAYFTSKLGGKPAWLDLESAPDFEILKCNVCNGPMKFLLQVYAPLDEPTAFHRVLYVFVCPTKTCWVQPNKNKNLLVLRCQLAQENKFYSVDPPDYDDRSLETITPEVHGKHRCELCGILSSEMCKACKKVWYCSVAHQTLDWKKGGHKGRCENNDANQTKLGHRGLWNYNEYEIVTDTEILKKDKPEKSDKKKREEFEKLKAEGKAGTLDGNTAVTKELLEAASYKSDKHFNKFRKRVEQQPDQILRYDRESDKPLWVSGKNLPQNISPCSYCNGPRTFEFQIMPQLLNFLGNDSIDGGIDWGTLVVYTCKASCTDGPAYKKEFIWRQDFDPMDKE